jgi:hypothetical protein
MTTIAVALAIQIEEAFRGVICYFEQPPHNRAKKPDQLVVLKTSHDGALSCTVFERSSVDHKTALSHDLSDFLANTPLRMEPARPGQPFDIIRFVPGPAGTASDHLEGYNAVTFEFHQPLMRTAA